jgi:hypothetical protein
VPLTSYNDLLAAGRILAKEGRYIMLVGSQDTGAWLEMFQQAGGHIFDASGELTHTGGDTELARDFLGVLAGKGMSRSPLEAGILSVEMCLMARDSCQTGTFQEAATSLWLRREVQQSRDH